MAKKSTIQVKDLDADLSETLDIYHQGILDGINFYSEKAVKDLAKKTKATAPEGARGSFKKNITGGIVKETRRGNTYAWYVKAPDYRLTHLLVHGHATRDGGRTKGNPFLANALKEVLEQWQKSVESVFSYYGKPRDYE